jgi:Tol biopolymer transport system component
MKIGFASVVKWAVASALVAVGCAPVKEVNITSTPPDAMISIDGGPPDAAPVHRKLDFSGGKNYAVVATKDGYEDAKTTIGFDPSTTVDYPVALAKKDRVVVRVVQIQPTRTDNGLELRPVAQETIAYLNTIEQSGFAPKVTQTTFNTDPAVEVGIPAMSPTDDNFVYSESKGGVQNFSSTLWRQDVGSMSKVQVTTGTWRDLTPAYSPDGKSVYFSSNRAGAHNMIWRLNASGTGGITKITSTDAIDYAPSLSGLGEFVVFNSIPPGSETPQIWTVKADGSQLTQFREGQSPKLSPDGKKILFIRNSTEIDKTRNRFLRQLWEMNVDGSGETLLSSSIHGDVKDPSWSPDGRWIMFACDAGLDSHGINNYDIYLMNVFGSQPIQLTTNGSWDDGPVMDHNQEFIYFRSNRGGQFNIWRFPTVGLGVDQLKNKATGG